MLNRTPSRFFLSLTSLTLLVHCGSDPAAQDPITNGTPTAAGSMGTTGGAVTTGQSASATSAGVNNNTSNGTTQTTSTTSASNTTGASGVTNTSGSAANSTTSNSTTSVDTSTTSVTSGAGGSTSDTAVTSTTGGPDVDQNGKENAKRGESTDVPQDYLRLGDIRILNNNWGSEDLGCTAPKSTMSVFVDEAGAFGWNFNRGDCAQMTDTSHPDFPQVEFGIHPFGIGSDLETSPPFSSTTVLPIQIKDIDIASITLDNFSIALNGRDSWNITMEFWLSQGDPREPNPGVYAEIMAWWGWDAGRWPCDLNNDGMVDYGPSVQSGAMSYTLCHQSDNWASGWRYFQFRAGDGTDGNIRENFSGTVDVKAFLDHLVSQRQYSEELWLTRMEVGSEIDDDTGGTVKMNNITFTVNDQSRSAVIGE